MPLDAEHIAAAMQRLVVAEPRFALALARHGPPEPRIRPPGYETLLRTIVAQQISTAAAAAVWRRLETALGDLGDPAVILRQDVAALRAAGLSRQKAGYALSLARHVADGSLPIHGLPADDAAAIALLTAVNGLGRWSAEVYLLFAGGRGDVFPAGDLAVQVQAGRMLLDGVRPAERQLRAMAEPWAPDRGVAAMFLWHCYNAPPM